MSIVTPPPPSSPSNRFTAADLRALPNEKDYELVDGHLEELHVGVLSGLVGARLFLLLGTFCQHRNLGAVLGMDFGYQCFLDDPEKVRKPDVSFIRAERMTGIEASWAYCRIAPDLAAEVISPNDLTYDVSRKVDGYLAAGVRLVWVLDPSNRSVAIYRQSGAYSLLSSTEELTGEDVVPGFRCQLSELFALPAGVV